MHLSRLYAEIERLRGEGRLRLPDDMCRAERLREQFGQDFVDAASNDYLGLAGLVADGMIASPGPSVSRETKSVGGAPLLAGAEASGSHSTEPALPPRPASLHPDGVGSLRLEQGPTTGAQAVRRAPSLRPNRRSDEPVATGHASHPALPPSDPALRATDPAIAVLNPASPEAGGPSDPALPPSDPVLRATDPAIPVLGPASPEAGRPSDPALPPSDPALRTTDPAVPPSDRPLPPTDPAVPREARARAPEPPSALPVSRETLHRNGLDAGTNYAGSRPGSAAFSVAKGHSAARVGGEDRTPPGTEFERATLPEEVNGSEQVGSGARSGPTLIPRLPSAATPAALSGSAPLGSLLHSKRGEGDFSGDGDPSITATPRVPAVGAPGTEAAAGWRTLSSPAPSLMATRTLSPPRAPSPPYRPARGGAVEPPSLLPALPSRPAPTTAPPTGVSAPLRAGGPKLCQTGPVPGRDFGDGVGAPPERGQAPHLGSGASRLIFGTTAEHLEAERVTAEWLGFEEALLFSSGYAANLGALGALLSPDDAVFSDALNHASLIDGIRLSRAQATVFPHLHLEDLERALQGALQRPARWVIVESYYSMDGDGPDLLRLRELCDRYDAHLYCDEAHSVGAFGPEGRGLCAQAGIRPDVLMAGFGKAVGAQGACVLGSPPLRTWLWNRARAFVFSTAPSPLLAHMLVGQIQRTRRSAAAREALAHVVHSVRTALQEAGIELPPGSFGPVVSIVVGGEWNALRLADRLQEQGILAQAVRPPTVPEGQSRIRLVLRSSLRSEQCTRLAQVVARETKSLLGSRSSDTDDAS